MKLTEQNVEEVKGVVNVLYKISKLFYNYLYI